MRKFSFGLRLKLVLFTTVLAFITYSASAFFIYIIYGYVSGFINQTVYNIIILLLGVIWSGILAYFAAAFLVKPLQNLEEAARKAAEGDIGEDVPLPQTDDEIRSLSIAFNAMLENLRSMVQNIDTTFMHTNSQVHQMRMQTSEAAGQAKEVSETIGEIAAGTEQSAASIQEIVYTIDQAIGLAQKVEEKAKQSDHLAAQMVQALEQSARVFHSFILGIQELAIGNEKSMHHINRLEEKAKQAGNIASVVSEIAAQTNLLALNASIEAARAGEHGKGFAVVAEEVRKLADESAHSAKSISDLLNNMEIEVQNAVQHMKKQVKIANEEMKRKEATELILSEMTVSIKDVADAIKQISSHMQQQMEHISYTGSQTKEVAAIAEETAAGAQQVSQFTIKQSENIGSIEVLAKDLEKQAVELKKTIEQFTI
ncbi:MAG: methyl-accepting chemotaxis protein [Ectobacillus sp.]